MVPTKRGSKKKGQWAINKEVTGEYTMDTPKCSVKRTTRICHPASVPFVIAISCINTYSTPFCLFKSYPSFKAWLSLDSQNFQLRESKGEKC